MVIAEQIKSYLYLYIVSDENQIRDHLKQTENTRTC